MFTPDLRTKFIKLKLSVDSTSIKYPIHQIKHLSKSHCVDLSQGFEVEYTSHLFYISRDHLSRCEERWVQFSQQIRVVSVFFYKKKKKTERLCHLNIHQERLVQFPKTKLKYGYHS